MKHELWTDKPTDNIVEISPDFSTTLRWKRDVVDIVASLSDSRKKQGLTQGELSERIGVSQPVIARFEKMGRIPTIEFLYKVADGLEVELMPLMPSNANGSHQDVEDDFPSSVFSKAQQNVYQIVAELTALRVKQRISQVELAKRIKTTQSVITRFERMGRVPTIEFLYKVAEGLGVELKPLRMRDAMSFA